MEVWIKPVSSEKNISNVVLINTAGWSSKDIASYIQLICKILLVKSRNKLFCELLKLKLYKNRILLLKDMKNTNFISSYKLD